VLAQASVAQLFIAGIVPGILIGLVLFPYAGWQAKRHGYPINACVALRERIDATIHALLVVALPALILGGIVFGIFTPTEFAGVVAVYILALCMIYRTIDLRGV
jgi:TRAP-type C4-dicarboxylate transport system permease large subunit